ncbi:hypothetical protein HDV03_000618, partial [Kappamyces sp. JEL0829]
MYTTLTLALLASLVSAHGRLRSPLALQGEKSLQVSNNNPCGNGVKLPTAVPANALQVTPGQQATFQWFIENGDGAGPLKVEFSQDLTGKGFSAPVTPSGADNVGGQNGNVGDSKKTGVQPGKAFPLK